MDATYSSVNKKTTEEATVNILALIDKVVNGKWVQFWVNYPFNCMAR